MLSSQRHLSVDLATCVTLAHICVQTTVPHTRSDSQMFTYFLTTDTAFVFRHGAPSWKHAHTCLLPQKCPLMSVCTGVIFLSTGTQQNANVHPWREVLMDPHVCPRRRGLYTPRCEYVVRPKEHGFVLSEGAPVLRSQKSFLRMYTFVRPHRPAPSHCPQERGP